MAIGYAIVAILAAAVAIFALQNTAPASVRFLMWSIDAMPISGVILFALAVGLVLGFVPLWIQRWRLRSRARGLENRINELERTLAERERAAAARERPRGETATGS
jgi:uncharacterized integral membrane protein